MARRDTLPEVVIEFPGPAGDVLTRITLFDVSIVGLSKNMGEIMDVSHRERHLIEKVAFMYKKIRLSDLVHHREADDVW
jgi:hypothetical protein